MSSAVPNYDRARRRKLALLFVARILESFGVEEEERERLVQIHARPQDYSLEQRVAVYRLIASRLEEVAETALNPKRRKAPRDARAIAETLRTINRLADGEVRNQEIQERQEKRPGPSPTWTEND